MDERRRDPGLLSLAPAVAAFGIGVGALVGALVGAASAGPPRVEHKRVPADMADDVTAAVRRAAAFLRAAQEADGGWTYGADEGRPVLAAHNAPWRPAFSCMAGVALARAGARPGDPAIDRLVAYLQRALAPRASAGLRATFLAKTYGSAAFLWFLAETGSPAMHADAAAAALALTNGAVEADLWGYELPDVGVRDGYGTVTRLPGAIAGTADLSNSQFAVLGLLAAERLGILRTQTVWERVRAGLRRIAHRDGGFGYRFHAGEPEAFARGNRSATAIAAACAFLAARREGSTPEAALEDPVVRGALRWLRQHPIVRRADGSVDTSDPTDPVPGRLPYYDLFAIERLGAFTGLDALAGVDWYRVGGRHLIASQQPDGGWPPGEGGFRNQTSALNAVFAVIFLTRAADDFPVTTPAVTAADVAGLADVPEPLFSDVAAAGLSAAARDTATPPAARAWRDAFFAAGARVLGVLLGRLASGSEAERAYVLRLLPDLVDGAPADVVEGRGAARWRAWYEANKAHLVTDPTARKFKVAPK